MTTDDLATARRVVATAADYATAERAASRLTDDGIAGHRVAVVARGPRPAGRLSGPAVARRGGLLGAAAGVLLGSLLTTYDVVESGWLTLWAAMVGAACGAASG